MKNIDKNLVDELDKLDKIKKEIEDKISNIKAELINIAKLENREFIFGTHKMCSIKPYNKVVYPEDKTSLVNLIKLKGLYEDLSMLNYSRISSRINKKELSQDIINLVKIEKEFKIILKDRGIWEWNKESQSQQVVRYSLSIKNLLILEYNQKLLF